MKTKTIKISFSVKVLIQDYMNEYQLDDEKQAADCIREDAQNAAIAQLEKLGFIIRDK